MEGAFLLTFLPLPFPFPLTSPSLLHPLPCHRFPCPFPSLPLEVGPPEPARRSEECCKLPQRGSGQSPGRKKSLVHSTAFRKPHGANRFVQISNKGNKPTLLRGVKTRLDLSWGVFWHLITATPSVRPCGIPTKVRLLWVHHATHHVPVPSS